MRIQNINIYKALPITNKQVFKSNLNQPKYSFEETGRIEQNSRMIFALGQNYFNSCEKELETGKAILEDVKNFIELGRELYFREVEFGDGRKIDFTKTNNVDCEIISMNEYQDEFLVRKSHLDGNLKPLKITMYGKEDNAEVKKSYLINSSEKITQIETEYAKANGEKISGYTSYTDEKPKRTFRLEEHDNIITQEYFRYGINAKNSPITSYSITTIVDKGKPETERYAFEGNHIVSYLSSKGKIDFMA